MRWSPLASVTMPTSEHRVHQGLSLVPSLVSCVGAVRIYTDPSAHKCEYLDPNSASRIHAQEFRRTPCGIRFVAFYWR
jgi:hypothetical protein